MLERPRLILLDFYSGSGRVLICPAPRLAIPSKLRFGMVRALMEIDNLLSQATDIVSSYVGRNEVAVEKIPELLRLVASAVREVKDELSQDPLPRAVPIIPIGEAVKNHSVICLACGREMKSLRQHIRIAHGLTPDQYRDVYNLPATFPMISRAYARKRREIAVKLRLGHKD